MTSIPLRILQYIVYYGTLGLEFFGPLALMWYGVGYFLGLTFVAGILDVAILIGWFLLWLILWAFSGGNPSDPLFPRF